MPSTEHGKCQNRRPSLRSVVGARTRGAAPWRRAGRARGAATNESVASPTTSAITATITPRQAKSPARATMMTLTVSSCPMATIAPCRRSRWASASRAIAVPSVGVVHQGGGNAPPDHAGRTRRARSRAINADASCSGGDNRRRQSEPHQLRRRVGEAVGIASQPAGSRAAVARVRSAVNAAARSAGTSPECSVNTIT